MEMTWQERAIEAIKFAIWLMNHPGASLDEFRFEQERLNRPTFQEWSAMADQFQKTGKWINK